MKGNSKPLGTKHFFVYTVSFLFIIVILAFSILYSVEKKVRSAKLEEVKIQERQIIELELEILGSEFRMIIADLNYLSRVFAENMETRKWVDRLINNWKEFSFQRGIYDQIRLIDAQGCEQIRINYSDGAVYAIPDNELQDKSDRYYFKETAMLGMGGIYISPLDLNIENGEIEVPYKPMIRFCTPLYDSNGDFVGIIVLNYLAESFLGNFKDIAQNSYGELALLNSDGGWLSSSDENREWNFMFEDKKDKNFSWFFPEWELYKKGTAQELTENGLFTLYGVNLSSRLVIESTSLTGYLVMGGGNLFVVSYVLRGRENGDIFFDEFGPLIKDIFLDNTILFVALLIIAQLLAVLIYLYMKSYRKTKIYSRFDSLTKVLNRRAGTEVLDKFLFQDDRRKVMLCLCFIDVNGLKQVNDVLGHKKGDELLVTVANIIKGAIREDDTIARMGGDEFIIILNGVDTGIAETIWSRIYRLLDKINYEEDRPYIVSVSHGIVCYDSSEGRTTSDELIKKADAVMYEEKRRIKQGVEFIRGKRS